MFKHYKRLACSEHFWKMRPANVHQIVAGAPCHIKSVKNKGFGRWGPKNAHQTVARARFHIKVAENWSARAFGALLEDEVGKMRTTDCYESSLSHKHRFETSAMLGVSRNRPHCQRYAIVGWFSATLLLCGFANVRDKTHWHGSAQQSMSDAAGSW